MFKFLAFGRYKAGPPRNSDFDVLSSVTVQGVTVKRDEVIYLLLVWTQYTKKVCMTDLGQEIERHCKSFRNKYVVEGTILNSAYNQLFARQIINAYKKAGLLGEISPDVYKLTKRGEQVRQFYVLLTGRRGTLHDRMNDFKQAKKK